MKGKLITILVAVLAVGLTLTAGLAGPVAADHAADDADLIFHENVTADNDTQEVWTDVAGAGSIDTADNTTTVTVTIDGLNGSESTELHNETLTIEEGNISTSAYQLADTDASSYDELTLTVEAANETGQYIDEGTSDWGTLVKQSGGGGGFLSGNGALGGGVGALVLLGAAYVFLKED